MKRHQITIMDIARELQISKSTVSRALTGHPSVKSETRKAVLELAHREEYQKNLLSLGLVKQSSKTIGIIVPEIIGSYFPIAISGAQEVAKKEGYHLIISYSDEDYQMEVDNTKIMMANRVDGLIVSITRQTKDFDHFSAFKRKGIPVVFFNRVCDQLDAPCVIVDDYDGAFKIVEHLICSGRKRIAHISGPDHLLISNKRKEGYKAALRKYDIAHEDELIRTSDLTMHQIAKILDELLSLASPPDALFAVNDPTAIEVIQLLKSKGIRIPEDVAVAGFSNNSMSQYIDPPLTTVNQPVKKMGQVAAEMLVQQIRNESLAWKPFVQVLNTELIVRHSG